jgi:hypothetical protein
MNYTDKKLKETQKFVIETANFIWGCYWCGWKWENEADIKIWNNQVACKNHLSFFERQYGKGWTKTIKDYE